VKNRSAPASRVVPVLVYDDVGAAIEWLCGAFGFSERLRIAGSDGRVGHAQLTFADGDFMLGASRIGQGGGADRASFAPPRPDHVSQRVHVRVDDIDRHFERAKRFGATIVLPPTDHPYGERQYTAADLAGHRWTFSQSIADVAPESWGAVRL
jgi:uncharacterized glyoxalase superfamily protein PhnB